MILRKIFSVLIALLLFLTLSLPCFAEPDVSAKAAVVICADSHEVIYSKNADERLPMASTTKIMSSLIALEMGADDTLVTVTDEMIRAEGTSMGLKGGDSVSTLSLVKGMLLSSGNDAANATAFLMAGGIDPFVELMNKRAQEIGMKNTHFVTPSGLDADGHYSTAYDMAILADDAIKNQTFLNICSSKSVDVFFGSPPYKRILNNHNKLLSICDGVVGVKTGFTKKSGRCLVSAMKKDGKSLIAVTLAAPNDWEDHMKLYDYALSVAKSVSLFCNLDNVYLKVVGGQDRKVGVNFADNIFYTTLNSNFTYNYKIYIKQFEYAPVLKDETVGRVDFYCCDGKLIKSVDLVAAKDVLSIHG